jgi:hypothetical protein
MDSVDLVQSVAAVATAIGVGIAAFQLRDGARQRRAAFEQGLIGRYQEIQSRIDLRYLIDDAEYDPADDELRRAMYDYFELCEEEHYYMIGGRASRSTWNDEWWPGIKTNMERPAFSGAWRDISVKAPSQFTEIRQLIDKNGS